MLASLVGPFHEFSEINKVGKVSHTRNIIRVMQVTYDITLSIAGHYISVFSEAVDGLIFVLLTFHVSSLALDDITLLVAA